MNIHKIKHKLTNKCRENHKYDNIDMKKKLG